VSGKNAGDKKVVRVLDHSRNIFAPEGEHAVSNELWHMLDQKQQKSVHGHLPGV